MIRFGLIGDGIIAKRHKEAIKAVNGHLVWIIDPIFGIDGNPVMGDDGISRASTVKALHYCTVDYVVICSPTYLHRQHVRDVLYNGRKVICEKPLALPWEPLIDNDDINIVLQLRYLKNLPKQARTVRAIMVRDDAFFKTWKGNPLLAGGNIYEFFIHYIDLAILLKADFEGAVYPTGNQRREIITKDEVIDILNIDMQELYNDMYRDILNGGGIKPKDIFYLTWVLNRNSELYGYRNSGLSGMINISRDLL